VGQFPKPVAITDSTTDIGLKKVLQEGEAVPEIFSDPLFTRSGYWILSTSAIFSKHFPTYGWGEVVPDGFGVAYMTGYDGQYPS
jgi:carnitine O-acetyltransferase